MTLHSDFEPRISKDQPPKPVLNGEEARLLYVAATRARELLVVPARLAEKWNVPPVPAISEGARSVASGSIQVKRPKPQLPAFAQVVAGPDVVASAPNVASPENPAYSRRSSGVAALAAQRLSSARAAPANREAAPGLLSSILSFFMGKK